MLFLFFSPCHFGKELLRTALALRKESLSAKEWTIILTSMTAAVLWPEALSTLQSMGQLRVESDAAARHAAFSGCIGESWWHARLLLEAEVARGLGPGTPPKDIHDAAAVSARAWGSWTMAGSILSWLRQSSLDVSLRTRTAAVSGLSRASAWSMAISASADCLDWDGQLVTTVAGACTRAAQWVQALHCFHGRERKSFDRKMQGSLVDALGKGHQLQKVLEILAGFRSHRMQPTVITLSAVIGACGGHLEGGRHLFLLKEMSWAHPSHDVRSCRMSP